MPLYRGFNFEGLPNRDSLKYIELYGLNASELETMFRGTLRYKVSRSVSFNDVIFKDKILSI